MRTRPVCLTIAGTDPSGGAGVAADLATFAAHGAWGACAVTAITVQDTERVHATVALDADVVRRQVEVVMADLGVAAIKVGMLGSLGTTLSVAAVLASVRVPVVVDPVLASSGGAALIEEAAIDALLEALAPQATLLTPNALEAERLIGIRVDSRAAAEAAGAALVARGAAAVLVKGGHLDLGDGLAGDCLVVPGAPVRWFDGPRLAGVATHGTGCVLSSAIAARLARGEPLPAAIGGAKAFVARAMAAGPTLGAGPGALDPWRAGPC